MNLAIRILSGIILLMVVMATLGWYMVPQLRRNEDYPKWAAKWILTMLSLLALLALTRYLRIKVDQGVDYGAAFFGCIGVLAIALVIAALWRSDIGGWLARPFGSLYDGGDHELDRHPLYSTAEARRKRGRYEESIAEIEKQLEKFPRDFQGQYLIAEIQAENLNDLPSAEYTIQQICDQRKHPPANISFALNSLADWHLKFARDPEAAKEALQKIIDRWPDSEWSALAAQRIAHLASPEYLLSRRDPKSIPVKRGIVDMGLLPKESQMQAPEEDPAKQAADYVQHLQNHPMDTEVRERLAMLYSKHYQRFDLATGELEHLIGLRGQPSRNVVRWLNLLADLKIEHGDTYESVRDTVRRIVDLFPGSAAANTAQTRIDHLKLELKRRQKSQTIRLGSYDQDIGLK